MTCIVAAAGGGAPGVARLMPVRVLIATKHDGPEVGQVLAALEAEIDLEPEEPAPFCRQYRFARARDFAAAQKVIEAALDRIDPDWSEHLVLTVAPVLSGN
jgi:hypothetical protein